jgi:hypothetical protein
MRSILVTALAGLAIVPAANAAVILEVEGNNASSAAQVLPEFNAPGDSVLIDGGLTPDDVDYYAITVSGPAQIVASIFGRPNSAAGDTIMALFNSAGAEIAFDDDSGVNLYSSLEANVPAGTYFLAVSGVGDRNFDGLGHNQNLLYKLIIGANVIPTPGTLALAGMGGLIVARRRRA